MKRNIKENLMGVRVWVLDKTKEEIGFLTDIIHRYTDAGVGGGVKFGGKRKKIQLLLMYDQSNWNTSCGLTFNKKLEVDVHEMFRKMK